MEKAPVARVNQPVERVELPALLLIVATIVVAGLLSSLDVRAFEYRPGTSLFSERGPIAINTNAAFTQENGVVSGNGTLADPFVIGPWYIRALGTAIRINGTDAHFVIRDIQVESYGYYYDVVVISNVSNGRIERLEGQGAQDTMVRLKGVRDVVVSDNWFPNSRAGVHIADSAGVVVSGNEIFVFSGVQVARSSRVMILDNRLGGGLAIDLVESSEVTVERNVVTEGLVRLQLSDRVALRDNELGGLRINGTSNVTLERNVFGGGVDLEGTARGHFASHNFTANTIRGASIRYEKACQDLGVDGESVAQLIVVDCERVRISNLTLERVGVGIHLVFVRSATVADNRLVATGIRVTYSTDALLLRNVIVDTFTPVYLEQSARTIVHGNNFAPYGVPADIGGMDNVWFAPYPEGGNYWSYHRAPDYCRGPAQDICDGGDGILDIGFTLGSGIVDRYPLSEPFGMVGEKPSASFSWDPEPSPLGEITYFRADSSSDPNGVVDSYEWDFGDGGGSVGHQGNQGWATSRAYAAQGLYVATLKVIDNQGLSAVVSHLITVTEPLPRPVAQFSAPTSAVAGHPVRFDAAPSHTPKGAIESYEWYFGDGSVGQGRLVNHTFETVGSFVVTLEIRNDLGYGALAQARIEIVDRIALVPYLDPTGFSIPVPQTWPQVRDIEFEGSVIELGLLGPYEDNFQTNILIDTEADQTVQESDPYLQDLADGAIADIRRDDPTATVLEGPIVRTIAHHRGVVFAILYPSENLVQKLAVVTSEVHARYWVVVLTTTPRSYMLMNFTFEEMLAGFDISRVPFRSESGNVLVPILTAVAATGAVVLVIVVLQSRRGRGLPQTPRPTPADPTRYPSTPAADWHVCLRCGSAVEPNSRFCSRCGQALSK